MSNAELMTLLTEIMQKLDRTEEAPENPIPTATATPLPTATPMPELSDDKEELEALMMMIMQKLQNQESSENELPAPTTMPVSETENEKENSIWENKKLIIEALPGYMFIQPTKEIAPDSGGSSGGSNNGGSSKPTPEPEHYNGEPCTSDGGTWWFFNGQWNCGYG